MQAQNSDAIPVVSIILPTHNRSASLKRTLDALCLQTVAPETMEVIVVADGCTDQTVAMLTDYTAPFALKVIVQPGQGAAAARNRGAAQAKGQLLLLLDDDVAPTPALVAVHLAVHRQRPGQVVIGPYPPAATRPTSLFQSQLCAWWEGKFRGLATVGHRFTYQDLLSGNCSLAAALFARIGGFDEAIADCGGEDYEFGIRLIQADIPFTFAPDALGYHHLFETTDLARSFQRARQEGRVDVRIGQRHPELRLQLPLAQLASYRWRLRCFLWLLFWRPGVGQLWATALWWLLHGLERVALYDDWQRIYAALHHYWYWRGVVDQLGSWRLTRQFAQVEPANLTPSVSICELDLRQGILQAAQQLDQERPPAVWLRFGSQPIGLIPPQPGAERLRGLHLPAILRQQLTVPYLEALAIEGASPGSSQLDRYRLFRALRAKWHWFGPTQIHQLWFEQYSQWNQLDAHRQQIDHQPDPNWEQVRRAEYEASRLPVRSIKQAWRIRLYHSLYRWHEPVYHWYTRRGWNWLSELRMRIKQLLLGASGEPR